MSLKWLTFCEIPGQARNDGRLFYGFLDALDWSHTVSNEASSRTSIVVFSSGW